MNNKNKKLFFSSLLFLAILLSLLTYRDFLTTLKLMLYQSYNSAMLPFDEYYKIILFYNLKNEIYNIGFPWMSRYIPNFLNSAVFQIFPCLKVNNIPEILSQKEYCAIWSISLVNFISTILFQVVMFYYVFKILRRNYIECILTLFTSYFIISFSDKFGIDRISILFCVIFLIFYEKKILTYLIILISIFINEKCTIFIATYIFCENIIQYKERKEINYIPTCLSVILFGAWSYFYTFNIDNDYHHHPLKILFSGDVVSYNYFSFHGLTNTIFPLIALTGPFFFYFNNKTLLSNFKLNKIYFLPIFVFIFFGILIGGAGNTGRYLIYTSPIYIPLINIFLIEQAKKILRYF